MLEDGRFCWTELVTRDPVKARAYYGALFDWTFEPSGHDACYWFARKDGRMVAGMLDVAENPAFAGIPSHWFTHIASDDLAATLEQVVAGGGEILRPAFDVPGLRIAIVRDSTGAVFGLCQQTGELPGCGRE